MRHEYPLEQLIAIKKQRLEKAERNLLEAKQQLEQEELALKRKMQECREAQDVHDGTVLHFYDVFQQGLSSNEILQHKEKMKNTLEKVREEEENAQKQRTVRDTAQAKRQDCQRVVQRKRVELEKISMHRKEWKREELLEEIRDLASEQDEIGATRHYMRQRKDHCKEGP